MNSAPQENKRTTRTKVPGALSNDRPNLGWLERGQILCICGVFLLPACAATPPPYIHVSAGQVFEVPERAFSVKAPEDDYLYVKTDNGVLFSPVGGSELRSDNPRGDYFIQSIPGENIPADVRGDLKGSAEWVEKKFGSSQAKKKMVTVKEEPRDFRGQNALYKETFLPELVREGPANLTVIDKPAFEYANLIFYQGGHLYYLSYGDAVNGKYYFKEKLAPAVNAHVGDRLQRFADGFAAH